MTVEICSTESCDSVARTQGLCPRHLNQKLYGAKELQPYGSKPLQKCAVSHCTREASGFSEGSLCEPHYQMKYRGVDPESRILRKDPARYDRKCWVPECGKRSVTKGLCHYHYRRARTGRLEVPESLGVKLNEPCSFKGCDRLSETKGLCAAHYGQLREGRELGEVRDWGKYTKGAHICEIPTCRKVAISQGLCENHKALQSTYRITPAEMVEVWTGPKCENPGCEAETDLHMDHDHATGQFRGLLCRGCNAALGFLKEDQVRIRRLAEYIERFQ